MRKRRAVLLLAFGFLHPSTLSARRIRGWSRLLLLALLCTSQAGSVSAGSNRWTSLGPEGGSILALVVDPITPTTLYAGTYLGGVFKSTNGGGNWNAVNTGLANYYVTDLAIDLLTPAILYAVTQGGVYKTTNGGGSWSVVTSGGELSPELLSLVIDPLTPATLYATAGGGSLLKSTNGGGNWSESYTGLGQYGCSIVAIDPVTPATLYALGEGSLLFKSTDGGDNWSALSTDLQNIGNVSALVIDPVTPTTLYAVTASSILKSMDGGVTWNAAHTGIVGGAHTLVIDPATPSTLYVATEGFEGGVYKSTNGGGNWFRANTGLTTDPTGLPHAFGQALAIDPKQPTTLYVGLRSYLGGFGGGVFKTTNSGGNWSSINTNLMNTYINTLAIDPATPATLYLGSKYTGVYKSTNGGQSWSRSNTGLTDFDIAALAVDPITPTILYAGTSNLGIFKSTNSGGSWSAINTGLDSYPNQTLIRSLAIDPATPTTLYAGTAGGVVKSTDSGGNWSAINTGLTSKSVEAMMIDPITPTTLYVGTYMGGVFKSTDGGENWSAVNTGLGGDFVPYDISALAIDPITPTTLYAGTEWIEGKGVFKTTNGGETWNAVNTGMPIDVWNDYPEVNALAIDPLTPSILYLGLGSGPGSQTYPELEGGVFKSTDGGGNWSAVDTGLTDFYINALAINPATPTTLYAATAGGGLYTNQQAPSLAINYPDGAPGSTFTITGCDFPPNGTTNIAINGSVLGTVAIDPAGGLIFYLQTNPTTDEGFYRVHASGNPGAMTQFTLEAEGIVHPQEGSGTVFIVPDGIAYQVIYLPLTMK